MFPNLNPGSIQFTDEDMAGYANEYSAVVIEAEDLCNVIDPVSTPYVSKYKARDILSSLCQKLEAYSVVARASAPGDADARAAKKKSIEQILTRVACLRVRLGTISYDCEEPHNAENYLELAADFFFPSFVDSVNNATIGADAIDGELTVSDPSMSVNKFDSTWYPMELSFSHFQETVHAMKCLNMLGILWAGRGQVKKSFMYLLAAKNLYHDIVSNPNEENLSSTSGLLSLSHDDKCELESLFTHNLYYLAQSYGHIGDISTSSKFCHETLRRQLKEGFPSTSAGRSAALAWAKNCAAMSNFYLNMEYFHRCYLALSAAERVLTNFVWKDWPFENHDPNLKADANEVEADIHRRFAHMELLLLKKANARRTLQNEHALDCLDPAQLDLSAYDDADIAEAQFNDYDATMDKKIVSTSASTDSFPDSAEASSSSHQPLATLHETLFPSLGLPPVVGCCAREIVDFENARSYFLRANSRIESAKAYYVLDGYVTDHYNLLEEQSRLYHYLAIFEPDVKRKLAMETKRIELLQPLLPQLSISSFEVLHKQISFELGEVYLALLEIKLDKFRGRSESGKVEASALKKGEIMKINSYCKGAVMMFAHFTSLYAPNASNGSSTLRPSNFPINFDAVPFPDVIAKACTEPDLSLITDEEVKPFLNAHFYTCRVLQRVVAPHTGIPETGAYFMAVCFKRYEWLTKFAAILREKKSGLDIDELFGQELAICSNMTELLPSKIDRMHRFGEGGLLM